MKLEIPFVVTGTAVYDVAELTDGQVDDFRDNFVATVSSIHEETRDPRAVEWDVRVIASALTYPTVIHTLPDEETE